MEFQSKNLTIPRGKVLFAKFKKGTQVPGPYRELGNCPEFNLTRESETFPHFSSQFEMRTKDEELTIEATLNGTVVTDDIKRENIEFWFMGETTTQTTAVQTGLEMEIEEVAGGDIYQLGRTDNNLGGYRNVTDVVVTLSATPATTLVLGEDYVLDSDLGVITFLAGGAAEGVGVKVEFGAEASSREITLASDNQIEGEMKFISFNPVGPQHDIIIPRARIAPNGDFALVNDPESPAWQSLPLSISALKKGIQPLAISEGRPIA